MPSGKGTAGVTNDHDGVAIAAGDAAVVDAAAELNTGAKKPKLQCPPSGRGTTAATNDHGGVARAAGDAAAVDAASELNSEAKEPKLQCVAYDGKTLCDKVIDDSDRASPENSRKPFASLHPGLQVRITNVYELRRNEKQAEKATDGDPTLVAPHEHLADL